MTPEFFPKNINVVSTKRYLGEKPKVFSNGYDSFNIADHVGDNPEKVFDNRKKLIKYLNLPSEPRYLSQIHSDKCLKFETPECEGDAIYTNKKNEVCAILTADCLPIFITDALGQEVAVIHAGWKGLLKGVIEQTLKSFDSKNLVAHFGPAISQDSFQVGEEVRDSYISKDKSFTSSFKTTSGKHYLDLYEAAKLVLNNFEIYKISGGTECTFRQKDEYFSFRRDGKNSGRMANLIWIN
jgi:YfiH family protein